MDEEAPGAKGSRARLAAFARGAVAPTLAAIVSAAPLAAWVQAAVAGGSLDEYRWPLLVLTHAFSGTLRMTVATTAFLAMLLFPLGALWRMVARARVRAGLADPLARLRAWVTRSPRRVEGALVAIVVAWTALLARRFHGGDLLALGSAHLLASLLGGWAQLVTMRLGLRALVRPTLGEAEADAAAAPAREGIHYDAVARTPEARAAILLVGAASAAMLGLVTVLPIATLMHDRRVFFAASAYVLSSLAAAVVFRTASRADIGLDGVRVYGTSRPRYVAYRDLDDVRASGVAIELVKSGRVVLALELHGADAARRGEVLSMIEAAIGRAILEKGSSEQSLVASSSPRDLVRGAAGAADYRRAAMSREQLWTVVASAASETRTRLTAIDALAQTGDELDRDRLRVALEGCAEPSVRIAVKRLGLAPDGREEEREEEPADPGATARADDGRGRVAMRR